MGKPGVKMTRAEATASAGKKRKVECGGELSYTTSSWSLVQLRSRRRRRRRVTVTTPENSNDGCASCCSSNGWSELDNDTSKYIDLEEAEVTQESAEIATSSYEFKNCGDRKETSSSSEVQAESGELESTAVRPSSMSSSQANSSRRRSNDDKMPSEAELEDFFSAAEKKLHQQFAKKYNFDVVKEEPLEGRYEWVRVKP